MDDHGANVRTAGQFKDAGRLIAVSVLAAVIAAGGPVAADDWPTFLGLTRDGKSGETGLRLEWPPAGPGIRWQREVGDGYSMPSVSAGRLLLFERLADTERLTCLQADSGEEIWTTESPVVYEDYYGYGTGPRASPVIDGDRVYTMGVAGRLRCQSIADGRLIWEIDTATRYGVAQNFFGTGATPVVEGGLLILPIGGSPPDAPSVLSGEVQGLDSGVVAFDKLTGEERYRITDELASYASPTLATIAGRRWAFVFARGGLIAFEPVTGQVDFRFPWRAKKLESVNAATPVVVGDTVFISESYGPGSVLLRVRPGAYDIVWQDPPGRGEKSLSSHWATPIHVDGVLYGVSGAGSGDAELRAVKLATGEVLWSVPGLGRSTLMLVDGHLIVLTERGRFLIVRVNGQKYDPVSDWTPLIENAAADEPSPLLEFPAWNAPILANGLLYAKGKGRLVCFDLMKGAAAVTFEAFSGVVVEPAAGRIFAMNPAGGIDAIGLADGGVRWHSEDADQPLLVQGSRLLAQFDVVDRPGQLGLVWLDADSGSSGDELKLDLPSGVVARIDSTVETTFRIRAKEVRRQVWVEWEFTRVPATGVSQEVLAGRPAFTVQGAIRLDDSSGASSGGVGERAPAQSELPEQLQALTVREEWSRPPWRAGGLFVHTQNIGRDPRQGTLLRRFDFKSGEELPELRLFGEGVLAKLVSADGAYQLGSRPVESTDARPLDHLWTVVSLIDGQIVATFRWPEAAARFFLVRGVLVVVSPSRQIRIDDEWNDESLALVGLDPTVGKTLWRSPIRDVSYQGSFPPNGR